MTKRLTKKQQMVLDCIEQYIEKFGYGPTVRDLCEMMGLSSPSTIHVHLKSLEEHGLINRDPNKSRSITVTHPREKEPEIPSAYSRTVELPVVGDVAAGTPILAEQNITDTMVVPTDIVGDSASFMLKVRGNSMIDIGINDGDYVVVKAQDFANNGDIVVAIIEDGATVKRFYMEESYVRLQPENSRMEPIKVRDCIIAGRVVAVFRRL